MTNGSRSQRMQQVSQRGSWSSSWRNFSINFFLLSRARCAIARWSRTARDSPQSDFFNSRTQCVRSLPAKVSPSPFKHTKHSLRKLSCQHLSSFSSVPIPDHEINDSHCYFVSLIFVTTAAVAMCLEDCVMALAGMKKDLDKLIEVH